VIERMVLYGALLVVGLSVLASVLPGITPSLVALGVLVLIARVVWFYTR
jgi:hypothetical protein